MKKISLLLLILLAYCGNITAQTEVPVPGDISPTDLDWVDGNPYQLPTGEWIMNSQFGAMIWNQDLFGNFVANDYPGRDAHIAALRAGETLEYTILDKEKMSFSIYTDCNQVFVFTPEEYDEFTEPTSVVPYTIFTGPSGNGTSHFEHGIVHFVNKTNHVEVIEGLEPFFKWRIGIQVHYTVDGVTTSNNIAYYQIGDDPYALGDANHDGKLDVEDVSLLIEYILGKNKQACILHANMNDDTKLDVEDVSMMIDKILGKNWPKVQIYS